MMHRRRSTERRRLLPGLVLLAVGVLVAVGAPVLWSVSHQDPGLKAIDAGVAVQLAQQSVARSPASPTAPIESVATATSMPPAAPTVASSAAPVRTKATASSKQTTPRRPTTAKGSTAPSTRSSPKPAAVLQPARLQIPAIGVDAPIEAVGVDDRGDMAIPEQVQQIGWYRYGAAPGDATGSVVMSGHVDSAQQGLGAFHDLSHLAAGDPIVVSDAAGRAMRYRVIGKEAFDKKTVPLADLFSRNGSARLTLITCGGAFDSTARSYLDNIVVTAVPG